MSNMQRGPSIDASYQVSLHLAERFQRGRLKCEIKIFSSEAALSNEPKLVGSILGWSSIKIAHLVPIR
jgi:hypothetical protein